MRSPRSKPFLLISASCLALVLIIFAAQNLVNRSNDRSDETITRAGASPPSLNQAPEPKEPTSHGWTDQYRAQTQWGFSLQRPEEMLLERKEKPQNEYLFWDEVQKDLALIIREKFPELRLSRRDLEALTESIRTLQNSMLALRALERTRSNREEIQAIRGQATRAMQTFEEITQMSISDFILYGRPKGGVDNGKPDDDEIVEEYLDHHKS